MKLYKLFILLIWLAIVSLIAIPTLALSKLHRSDPPADAILNHSPAEVFVWFSEPLSTGSNLIILDDQFQRVDKGQTFIDASDATLMRVQVNYLWPGRYTVSWKANPVSGRNANGSYAFSIDNEPISFSTLAIIGVSGLVAGLLIIAIWRLRRHRLAAI
jgi:methionine-rich copper-binding protein CopC